MRKVIAILILSFLVCVSRFAQNSNMSCPSISVTGPKSVTQPDETMTFSASIGDEVKNYNVEYKWAIDKGTIISGQGTTTIRVSTDGLEDTVLNATFEIIDLPQVCKSKSSEAGVVAVRLPIEPLDQYGSISLKMELARFDSLLSSLSQNSAYIGYVWIRTDKNENVINVKKRIRKLIKHIKFRRISLHRIIFIIEKSDYHETTLLTLFKETKLPKCVDCEIIKASDFK